MALTIHVEQAFVGLPRHTYFMQVGRWRLRLPAWLTPGA